MKTMQEIFDQSASHLLAQMAVSMNKDTCAYRGESGLMCAVGCLISDEHYDPNIEGDAISSYWVHDDNAPLKRVLIASGINIDDPFIRKLLRKLQTVHDDTPPEHWRDNLWLVAVGFGLNAEVLQ